MEADIRRSLGDFGCARGAQKGETMAQKTFARPLMFTRQALWRLILPLVLEQLLLVTVGMADTVMVSTVGEAAVSGISLVDQVNVLLIQIFAALATGGAVVASQYLGRRDRENACRSAKQLVYATFGMAVAIGALVLVLNRHILRLVFGNVEPDVMQAAETYFWLSALSYPMLALYNAGAALFPQHGQQPHFAVRISYHERYQHRRQRAAHLWPELGRGGAAMAALASRTVAGLMMMLLLRNRQPHLFLSACSTRNERRHPQKHSAWAPNGLEKRYVPGDRQAAGCGSSPPSARRLSQQCHLNNVGSMSTFRLGHRPGDDHLWWVSAWAQRLSGAALYENPFGGGLWSMAR